MACKQLSCAMRRATGAQRLLDHWRRKETNRSFCGWYHHIIVCSQLILKLLHSPRLNDRENPSRKPLCHRYTLQTRCGSPQVWGEVPRSIPILPEILDMCLVPFLTLEHNLSPTASMPSSSPQELVRKLCHFKLWESPSKIRLTAGSILPSHI